MTVKCVKLLSGEEIIGDFHPTAESKNNYVVDRPRATALVPISQHQAELQLIPWLYTNPDGKGIEIPKNAVSTVPMIPDKGMADKYTTETSGIIMAAAADSSLLKG